MFDKHHGCGCDAPETLTALLPVKVALEKALSVVSPLPTSQPVALASSLGQTTTHDIKASVAMPFFRNSAMDGYAVGSHQFQGRGPWVFKLACTVAAGESGSAVLPKGKVARIYTGAPVPEGCDSVIMAEHTGETAGGILFRRRPLAGENIREVGSDQPAGALLVPAGTRLAPRHIGLLAANGINEVPVRRSPRVAVFSTGDEIVTQDRKSGQIYDANRPMLLSLLKQAGIEAADMGVLPDDLEHSATMLAQAAKNHDLILTSGAVSMGGRDFLRPALEAAGGTIEAWRVALKPGKPVMFGRLGQAVVTGLPGNPFAVMVTYHLFAAAQLRRLQGMAETGFAGVPAQAGFNWTRKAGRDEVFPVRLHHFLATGVPVLERLGRGVSATLLPVAAADGLAVVPGQTTSIHPGDPLMWQPFETPLQAG